MKSNLPWTCFPIQFLYKVKRKNSLLLAFAKCDEKKSAKKTAANYAFDSYRKVAKTRCRQADDFIYLNKHYWNWDILSYLKTERSPIFDYPVVLISLMILMIAAVPNTDSIDR